MSSPEPDCGSPPQAPHEPKIDIVRLREDVQLLASNALLLSKCLEQTVTVLLVVARTLSGPSPEPEAAAGEGAEAGCAAPDEAEEEPDDNLRWLDNVNDPFKAPNKEEEK